MIQTEGIPNGWEAVAFKPTVVGEYVLIHGMIILLLCEI